MEPRGREGHRWANREVEMSGEHMSQSCETSEFQVPDSPGTMLQRRRLAMAGLRPGRTRARLIKDAEAEDALVISRTAESVSCDHFLRR
jgi:hypothetical protein